MPANRIDLRLTAKPSEKVSTEIYRPFFIAGIISVLTAGCMLGAIALVGISLQGSYVASTWTPYVLAHANSQLYGWVGFFVMGYTLQQHSPKRGALPLFMRLAWSSLILMAIGIGLRFAAEPLAQASPGLGVPLGVFSCALQFLAVLLFVTNVSLTRSDSGGLTWQTYFIFASLFYLLVVSAVEPFYFAASHVAGQQGILAVAHWASLMRDSQFLGFVANMIFGVSLIRLGQCFNFPTPSKGLGLLGFGLWNAGLLTRLGGWHTYFTHEMDPSQASLYFASAGFMASGAAFIALASKVFEQPSEPARSHKFVRTAYVWLLIGGMLMALEPLHLRSIGQPFSHAYIGGIRHALTVGFISQMIVGFSLHIAARMNDIPESSVKQLWLVFILLNLGNAARVALEIATDHYPAAFAYMAPTGFIELTGICIWAADVVLTVVPRRRRMRHAA